MPLIPVAGVTVLVVLLAAMEEEGVMADICANWSASSHRQTRPWCIDPRSFCYGILIDMFSKIGLEQPRMLLQLSQARIE